MKRYILLGLGVVAVIVSIVLYVGKNPFCGEVMSNTGFIELNFGKQGVKDFQCYSSNADNHPSGVGFSSIYFAPDNLGNLRIVGKKTDIEIPNVITAMGVQYGRFADDGIMGIDIDSRLHEDEFVPQEVAYEAYVAFMKEINRKEWQQDLTDGQPRIDIQDNLKRIRERNGQVIDPSYILTFEEWRDLDMMFFDLWNNDLLLGITISRRPASEIPEGVEQYTVRYAFNTQKYSILNMIKDSYKMSEKELKEAFKDYRERILKSRDRAEANRLNQGYRIDESRDEEHNLWQYLVD